MSEPKGVKSVGKIKDAAQQAAHAEAAPASTRRYRSKLFLVALVFVAVAFGVLTFLVKTTPSFPIDLQITRGVQSINIPLLGWLMTAISWAGFGPQSVIITVLITLVIYGFGLHWEAVMALIAAVSSSAVNVLVKDLIQRPRPLPDMVHVYATLHGYSFPSGHVMFYLGFFGFIGFLTFTLLKPSLKRSLLLVLFGGLVVLIGVSRIYLGEHWASDVLGSYLLGSLMLVAIIEIYRWGKTRFFVHQPVAADGPQKA